MRHVDRTHVDVVKSTPHQGRVTRPVRMRKSYIKDPSSVLTIEIPILVSPETQSPLNRLRRHCKLYNWAPDIRNTLEVPRLEQTGKNLHMTDAGWADEYKHFNSE